MQAEARNGSRHGYAWAAHYLCEMGKAVVDDLTKAMLPSG
ncbi:DUF3077 domain-containing protein [Pseudomonas yamanorum]|nr:DUF3077 domain-containing protein [Pseudomonas yamanorum]